MRKFLHHEDDVIQKSMQYFRAPLEKGDKDKSVLKTKPPAPAFFGPPEARAELFMTALELFLVPAPHKSFLK